MNLLASYKAYQRWKNFKNPLKSELQSLILGSPIFLGHSVCCSNECNIRSVIIIIVLYSFIVQVDRTQLTLGLHLDYTQFLSSFAYIVYL